MDSLFEHINQIFLNEYETKEFKESFSVTEKMLQERPIERDEIIQV